jgi:Na+-translocating ferredoxin:NAD+ oxidoreductase subunit B
MNNIAEKIDALLPQTQCTQCGYAGCKPYAEAIAQGQAEINQCPPGGAEVIGALAQLLKQKIKSLNPHYGVTKAFAIAVIDENRCIGCTLCIKACPVDAIIGATKQMHSVINAECTGCELCLAPCPVDCIVMQPATTFRLEANPALWRKRYQAHLQRLARNKAEKAARLAQGANQHEAEKISVPTTDKSPHTTLSPAVSAALRNARARQLAAKNKLKE